MGAIQLLRRIYDAERYSNTFYNSNNVYISLLPLCTHKALQEDPSTCPPLLNANAHVCVCMCVIIARVKCVCGSVSWV